MVRSRKMKINYLTIFKFKFKLSNCDIQFFFIVLLFNLYKIVQSINLTDYSMEHSLSDYSNCSNDLNESSLSSPKIKLVPKTVKSNCSFKKFVHLLDSNLSFNDFLQIIALKINDELYFGKKIVREDSVLVISCIKRFTNKTNQSEWFLNTQSIDEYYPNRNKPRVSSSYRTYQYLCENFNLIIYKLVIKKVSFLNTGEYRCINHGEKIASLDFNSKKHFVNVAIVDWENFNNELQSKYFDFLNFNQTIEKYCSLPCPIWYKWSTKLNLNNSILRINESGLYTCKSEKMNRLFNYWIFEFAKIENFVISGSTNVNGELKLECNVTGFPLPEIHYFIGKSRIDTSREKFSRFEFDENLSDYPNSILHLYNLTKNDANVYVCKARIQIENWNEIEMEEKINIIDVKKFRLNLKGFTDVECPNVAAVDSWYFKDEKIDFEETKKYKLKNNGKTLTIVNADTEQEGDYKCEFNKKNHTLNLVTAPRIHLVEVENCRIDLKSVHAYLGKKFRIDCKSNNQNIKYTMRWLKNGQEIKNEVTNQLSLEMNDLKESARANYTCQATNDVGHFNIDFNLRVRSENAYLWPISGIIAEIIILLTVIWWNERNKDENVVED